jgi:hypothetical protein
LHCQRCGASDGFVQATRGNVPRLAQVRGIVLLSKTERETEAPPSIVDTLLNKEHDKEAWLQQPGEHSFNDAMGGDTRYSALLSKKEQK